MRRKRSVGVFLIITALIIMLLPVAEADAATPASAFTVKGGKLTRYKGTDKTVTVPDNVEVIGESAFGGNATIEKVILPDSVTEIEAYSFWGCDSLKTVQLGRGMTLISDFAFTNCSGLEAVTIPSSVHYIGIQAFSYCNRLEDITIPPEVTDISEDAFDGDYLLNIHCEPGSYADKYAQAFYIRQKNMPVYGNADGNNKPQDGTAVLPSGNLYPPSGSNNQETMSYEIPGQEIGSTKVVANQAVVLIQNAGLPVQGTAADGTNAASGTQNGVEGEAAAAASRIIQRAHYRDADLKEAVVPEGILEIEAFAYARSGIERLNLPAGVEQIDYAAFYHCDDLESVELPESLKTVAAKAFSHTSWMDGFLAGTDGTTGDFLISGGVLVAYRGNGEDVVIPDGVRIIAGEAFAGHSEIKKVILPDTLQEIDREAFKGCHTENVEYQGTLLDQNFVEEMVVINSMSAVPEAGNNPVRWTWIAGVFMLLLGSFLLIKRTN